MQIADIKKKLTQNRFTAALAVSAHSYPPGYEYRKERNAAGILLALGAFLSLRFLGRLYTAVEELYYMDRTGGRSLRPGAQARSFTELAAGCPGMFLPFFLFLGAMAVYHYFYYYRDTRSIYLMKRLPDRRGLAESCVRAPLQGMAAGAVCMLLMGLLYYGIYLLAVPPACMPRF